MEFQFFIIFKTPLDLASVFGHFDFVEILKKQITLNE